MKVLKQNDNYLVDDQGNIYVRRTGKKRKFELDKYGYYRVGLWKNNKSKTYLVHRLIISNYLGDSKLEVNHKNGVKTDNRLENLEYVTSSENSLHAFKLGLKSCKGEKNSQSKLIDADIERIREFNKKGLNNVEIGRIFKVSRKTISDVILGKTWTHVGAN